jgi:precorrin-8X/cobalt-precorrin-8 methylmutase
MFSLLWTGCPRMPPLRSCCQEAAGVAEGIRDHPIFTESVRRIQALLAERAAVDQNLAAHLQRLAPLEREVLERCIHSSGDVSIALDLVFAPAAADRWPHPRRPVLSPPLPPAVAGIVPADSGGQSADPATDRPPPPPRLPIREVQPGVPQGTAGSSRLELGARPGPAAAPVAGSAAPCAAAGQQQILAAALPGSAAGETFQEHRSRAAAVAAPATLASPAESACERALAALRAGAPILTDTAMAAAAVAPMVRRSFGNPVHCLLDWAPPEAPEADTRSAAAIDPAWRALSRSGPAPLVLIGSAPTALERLLQRVAAGMVAPSLLIGMPVGFVGVAESKRRLAASGLPQIRLEGSRGGAALVAAALNALLRRAWLDQAALPL